MGYRLSAVAGIAAIGLALARLQRLFLPSIDGLPWEIAVAASALLAAALTWAMIAYGLGTRLIVGVNLIAATLMVVRLAVPSTTWFLLPTAESLSTLTTELEFARDVIRSGVAPVLPLAGVIAVVSVLFWFLGAVLSWGLARGHPYLAVLPPLVAYLQFATMDRAPSGSWPWVFLPVLGLTLLAVALDRRRSGTGTLATQRTRLALMRSVPALALGIVAVTTVLAVGSAGALAGLVPRSGFLEWRVSRGLSGSYYGSVSYNPFVGIRQGLVSQTNVPVFVAELAGRVAADEAYWRLVTLDSFSGSQWFLDERAEVRSPEELGAYEDPGAAFKGPTAELTQTVTILALQQDWVPAVYAPTRMVAANRAVERGFRVKADDGSLRFDALSYRGMTYRVDSAVPEPDLDTLARTAAGGLSPVFARAAADGRYRPGAEARPSADAGTPPTVTQPGFTLPDEGRYLALPEDPTLEAIAALTREQTAGLSTDFERALALESFFRESGEFAYSTQMEPGHAAGDLADWLTDPDSPNYRTGYCEQYATSMAVMARQAGIPSRVVLGFAPGTRLDDGRVVVRDRNAHAWVELWMASQGWVRFDPTPRGDGINPAALDRLGFEVAPYFAAPEAEIPGGGLEPGDIPVPAPSIPDSPPPVPVVPDTGSGSTSAIPTWMLGGAAAAAVALGAVPGAKWLRRRRRLRRLRDGDISAAWAEMVDRLTDLGAGPRRFDTPVEFAEATDPALTPLAEAYGSIRYGPPATSPDASLVAAATTSFERTTAVLAEHFSGSQRLRARYRIRSLIGRR